VCQMGKNGGFLTPKAISNRIKAKGLQKLRWYCQMCQKQCRDENGFKCHTTSESHQRQMAIFSESPHKFLDSFSHEFEESFLRHLRHRHGTKRVHANMVYAELIKDRHHLHMNATKWTSLSEFVKYLGRTSKCTVDETPKGWFIAYIDRDPDTIARKNALERRKKADLDEEEREQRRIKKQLEEARCKAAESAGEGGDSAGVSTTTTTTTGETSEETAPADAEAEGEREAVKIAFSLGALKKPLKAEGENPVAATPTHKRDEEKETEVKDDGGHELKKTKRKMEDAGQREQRRSVDGEGRDDQPNSKRPRSNRSWDQPSLSSNREHDERRDSGKSEKRQPSKPLSAVEEIVLQEERRKQREREKRERERERAEREKALEEKNGARTDYWLAEGIVVKVKHKTVGGGKYFNQKGVVEKVEGHYVGQVKILQSGDVLRLDQDFLETVLPAIGGKVRVLNGVHRGQLAKLQTVNVDEFCATIQLDTTGEVVKGVTYEDISKVD